METTASKHAHFRADVAAGGATCRWQARLAWMGFWAMLALPFLTEAVRGFAWSWPGVQAMLAGLLPDGWRLIRAWGVFYKAPVLLCGLAAVATQIRLWRHVPASRPRPGALAVRAALLALSLGGIVVAVQNIAIVVDGVVENPLIEPPLSDRAIRQTLLGQLARVAAGTDFDAVIAEALAQGDTGHARVHAEAVALLGIPLRPETTRALADATSWQATILRQSWEVMRGGATGRSDSLGSLAGALAVDLTPAGDLRDIAYQLGVMDEPDRLVLGLSVFGLGLTAMAVIVPQQAVPARVGKALLKTAARFSKVSAGVGADIRRIGTNLVDLPAARRALGRFDLSPRRAAGLVRQDVAAEVGRAGGHLYRIRQDAGAGAALAVLGQADSLADLPLYRRIARAMGQSTEAVIGLLGKNSKSVFRVYRAGRHAKAALGAWLAALLAGLGGLATSLSGSILSYLTRRRLRRPRSSPDGASLIGSIAPGGSVLPRLQKGQIMPLRISWVIAPLAAMLLFSSSAGADQPPPEGPSGRAGRVAVTASRHMIVTANALATEAGEAVLARGGSAVDAMVAAQFVLNLVEPQSSGIGGGAFMLHWDAQAKKLTSFDGRETAPMAATPELFMAQDGTPMPFADAVPGGRSVGVPGTLALVELAHRLHGTLSWAELVAPAMRLAERGFEVSPRLAGAIAESAEQLRALPATRGYFLDTGGAPLKAGTLLRNQQFADTLRAIAKDGSAPFYRGPIGDALVETVRNAPVNPSGMTGQDLQDYRVVLREPVCRPYRAYEVCGMRPPSSGGVAVLQILGLLEHFDMAGLGATADGMQALLEASKLAFADRNLYLADSDFVRVPVRGLLDQAYLTARAQQIRLDTSIAKAVAGNPPWREAAALAPDESDKLPGTSHLVIVDDAGDAVSMTTTIESGFGSGLMVGGFLLNNELTDFSFAPSENGRPIANRVEPGKRPRSSMAPTMVFDEAGEPVLLIGSPGGSQIIGYVAQALVGVLDWGMSAQEAVAMGHVLDRNGPAELEAGTEAASFREPLVTRGQQVQIKPLNSGLHAIRIDGGRFESGVDPRREGAAQGQ